MSQLTTTGAGTSAAGFNPLSLSPVLWLKADAGTYQDAAKTTPASSDTDPVGNWEDQSGNGNDVTQATAANKPLLKLNIQNSRPVIRFDGTNDYLQDASFAAALSQPFSIFAVMQLDATVIDDGNQHIGIDGIGANRMAMYQNPAVPDVWALYAGAVLAGSASDANWNIWSALFNGASSQFWINNTSQASGNAGAHNPAGATIGSNPAGNLTWKGDIAEVIIYDPSLSDADRALVQNYLSIRWGITLA